MRFNYHAQTSSMPLVSIILSVRNEERTIEQCLQSLVTQSYKRREIIVIDDESHDKTPQIVQKFPVEYYRIKHLEGSYCPRPRKIGLKKSNGSIIFFTEADAYYEQQFIEKCIRHFQNGDVGGVFGCLRMWKLKDTTIARIRELNYRFYEMNPKVVRKRAVKGLIAAWFVRKEVFDQIGGIDDSVYGADTSWTRKLLKMGYKLKYEPSALWWHNFPDTIQKSVPYQYTIGKLYAKTTYTEAKGQSRFKKYLRIYAPKVMYFLGLPFLLILCILGFLFSSFFFPYLLSVTGLYIVMPYLRKMAQLYSVKNDKKDILAILVYPLISLLLNYAFVFGLIVGFIKRSPTASH